MRNDWALAPTVAKQTSSMGNQTWSCFLMTLRPPSVPAGARSALVAKGEGCDEGAAEWLSAGCRSPETRISPRLIAVASNRIARAKMSCPSGKLAQFNAKGNPPQNPTPKMCEMCFVHEAREIYRPCVPSKLGERLSARRESGAIRTGGRLGDSSGPVYVHMDETTPKFERNDGFA